MDYADYLPHLAHHAPDLADQFRNLRGLAGVMAWMTARGIALSQVEIIQQDEFSSDFLFPLAKENRWVVFGITWLGALTAVAVWNHRPNADELLERRLAEGWKPTLTRLRSGEVVLGHAACLLLQAKA